MESLRSFVRRAAWTCVNPIAAKAGTQAFLGEIALHMTFASFNRSRGACFATALGPGFRRDEGGTGRSSIIDTLLREGERSEAEVPDERIQRLG
jgi:hypothetical protein